jgi:hypothetical protein
MATNIQPSRTEIPSEAIARRAHEIWETEGRPEGRAMEHWLEAEASLRSQAGDGAATEEIKSASRARRSTPSRGTTPARREKRFEAAL